MGEGAPGGAAVGAHINEQALGVGVAAARWWAAVLAVRDGLRDRRAPRGTFPHDRLSCLAWSDVVEAALVALRADVPRAPATLAARSFAETTLDALRMRFGGHPEARALVERLHQNHPRDAARCANVTPDDPDWDRLHPVAPNALWHLRTRKPSASAAG